MAKRIFHFDSTVSSYYCIVSRETYRIIVSSYRLTCYVSFDMILVLYQLIQIIPGLLRNLARVLMRSGRLAGKEGVEACGGIRPVRQLGRLSSVVGAVLAASA